MNQDITGYDVGALLYCPANTRRPIADLLKNERFPHPFSLAFCLEDTIREEAVDDAEQALHRTLGQIAAALRKQKFYTPLIFVRVRSPRQLRKLAAEYGVFSEFLTGFILPKFFIENCDMYIEAIQDIRDHTGLNYLYMPIFESPGMIDLRYRYGHLALVKDHLDAVSDRILNVRVGGNDLSHAFGLRRHVDNTIYDVRPVADLLTDIVTTFATQYVVSGPVWEYYAGSGWEDGLRRELELDLLCGLTGKTVIHPNQIPVVNACLKVTPADYQDARRILNWDSGSGQLVASSAEATRMNEYNTHFHWANRIVRLARIYGVRDGAGLPD